MRARAGRVSEELTLKRRIQERLIKIRPELDWSGRASYTST